MIAARRLGDRRVGRGAGRCAVVAGWGKLPGVTGRGFGLENALLALAIALGVGVFLRRSWHLYRLMRLGGPERRLDRPRERWLGVLKHVLGQGRLLSEPYSGVMHAMLFWGFLVITVMTTDMLLTGVIPGLSLPW